jgi:threonine dehydrogenase-like Zn-dependent dehydrogenase
MNTLGVGVNRPGAFAEYLSVPAFNVFKLPEAITDDMAAILDPLGNATHTALSFDLVGEDVLITGAGPIGIMAVAIARYAGARHIVITDINDYRLELARKMGASRALNVTRESLDDFAAELMPGCQRHRYRALCPVIPLVDVNVGAADRRLVDLNQDIVVADLGHRDILHPDPTFCFSFY